MKGPEERSCNTVTLSAVKVYLYVYIYIYIYTYRGLNSYQNQFGRSLIRIIP